MVDIDRNLLIKATIYHIKCVGEFLGMPKDLFNEIYSSLYNKSMFDRGILDPDVDMEDIEEGQAMPIEDGMRLVLVEIEDAFLKAFNTFLPDLLKEAYGKDWSKLVLPQPWSLVDILTVIKTEFILVFEKRLPHYQVDQLDTLLRIGKDISRNNQYHTASMTNGDLKLFALYVEPFLLFHPQPSKLEQLIHQIKNYS